MRISRPEYSQDQIRSIYRDRSDQDPFDGIPVQDLAERQIRKHGLGSQRKGSRYDKRQKHEAQDPPEHRRHPREQQSAEEHDTAADKPLRQHEKNADCQRKTEDKIPEGKFSCFGTFLIFVILRSVAVLIVTHLYVLNFWFHIRALQQIRRIVEIRLDRSA